MSGTVHVIGAGLAGLSCALRLAERGRSVRLYEAARMAGGRCRSYFDSELGLTIDNGNHLLLSGNRVALDYVRRIGGEDALSIPPECVFDFAELKTGLRWRLRPNASRLPWWIFAADRGVPGAGARDYLNAIGLLFAGREARIPDVLRCEGALYERLWRPVLLAGLNTDPLRGSAALAGRVVRETLGAGGDACRPVIAAKGLDAAFVAPALTRLAALGVDVRFGARLRGVRYDGDAATTLDFGEESIALEKSDRLVLAVPPWAIGDLAPGVSAPNEFRAIVNAHFKIARPPGLPPLTGIVDGLAEWLFGFPDRLSVTISDANRLLDDPKETLAENIWSEVAAVARLPKELPPYRIVKEKRATFAATPEQEKLRPDAGTRWLNLFLAGDWTATGLPATIEGAIRSGERAAGLAGA
jgi:hydroxysqualene dehydroxylase